MNPQGHNAQQNNPPPHAAPPAGRWDEGANLNNAPVPLTIPPPRSHWRQRCADAGYIAGDEQVQPYVQNHPLLDDDGQMNIAGLYGFVGTVDSISQARAAGIDRPLAELAALMQARNWTMDAIDQAQTALDERSRAQLDAAQNDVQKLRSALAAEQAELRKLQDQIAQAQRMVLKMVRGEQPVGSMVGPAQGGVRLIPEPTAMTRLLRLVERHPMTTVALILITLFALVYTVVSAFSLQPSSPQRDAEDDGGIRPIFAVIASLFLAYMFMADRLLEEDRNAG